MPGRVAAPSGEAYEMRDFQNKYARVRGCAVG